MARWDIRFSVLKGIQNFCTGQEVLGEKNKGQPKSVHSAGALDHRHHLQCCWYEMIWQKYDSLEQKSQELMLLFENLTSSTLPLLVEEKRYFI